MTIYSGSCHCKRVRFEVDIDVESVRVCDCSICHKRGALNVRITEDKLKILTPLDDLTLYQWHTKTARDYFCPDCGILPFRRPRTAPEIWTVNTRCLDDIDTSTWEIERVFGSRLD